MNYFDVCMQTAVETLQSNDDPESDAPAVRGLLEIEKRVGSTTTGLVLALRLWAMSGLPQAVVSHRLAASFAATSANAAAPTPPFDALAVRIPSGMLPVFNDVVGREEFIEWALLAHYGGGRVWLRAFSESGMMFGHNAAHVTDLSVDWCGFGVGQQPPGVSNQTALDQRAMDIVGRIVFGVLMEFESGAAAPAMRDGPPGKTKRSGQPKAWTFEFRRAVAHDVREAITDYVRHGTRIQRVQVLVRGHWKRQVHGKGRSLRKTIHVEPYWRGAEDAPIGVTPRVFA